MKANYEKPVIFFEDFELNQAIATTSSCGESAIGKTNHYTKYSCGYIVDDIIIWVGDNMEYGCDDDTDPDAEVYGYCYNTPTSNMQLFSS
ncbi:MAG: hypothetical protein LUH07_08455 [Lachnospiraceae bacterium]|nr:hypothetical protein [Lachnospiraceae bacterium]